MKTENNPILNKLRKTFIKWKPRLLFLRIFAILVAGTVGVWYREESKSKIDGVRDASGKDYLWGKLAVGYDGMTDYENGVLPIPIFVELRYWHLESARNTLAYMDSYWEAGFAIPLWKW